MWHASQDVADHMQRALEMPEEPGTEVVAAVTVACVITPEGKRTVRVTVWPNPDEHLGVADLLPIAHDAVEAAEQQVEEIMRNRE